VLLTFGLGALLAACQPSGAATFTVEGTTLFLDGPIVKGDVDQMNGMLAAHPEVRRLSIDSPGGDLATGLRLGRIVRDRTLETYVEGGVREAASAAAYVFLGGTERIVKGRRGIGVHAFYTPAAQVRAMVKQKSGEELIAVLNEFERSTQESTMSVVEYVVAMIGDTRIVAEAVKTGSDALVWPDAAKLLDLKVATKLVELAPEEIPDPAWFYGEVVAELGARLDPTREDALDERSSARLAAWLADEERQDELRRRLDEVLAQAAPPNRVRARTDLVRPIADQIVQQIVKPNQQESGSPGDEDTQPGRGRAP
jgi:hypothetical protein